MAACADALLTPRAHARTLDLKVVATPQLLGQISLTSALLSPKAGRACLDRSGMPSCRDVARLNDLLRTLVDTTSQAGSLQAAAADGLGDDPRRAVSEAAAEVFVEMSQQCAREDQRETVALLAKCMSLLMTQLSGTAARQQGIDGQQTEARAAASVEGQLPAADAQQLRQQLLDLQSRQQQHEAALREAEEQGERAAHKEAEQKLQALARELAAAEAQLAETSAQKLSLSEQLEAKQAVVNAQAAALQRQLEAAQAEAQKVRADNLQLQTTAREAAETADQHIAKLGQLHAASQAAADGKLAELAEANKKLLAEIAGLHTARSQLQSELESVQAIVISLQTEHESSAAQAESAVLTASQISTAQHQLLDTAQHLAATNSSESILSVDTSLGCVKSTADVAQLSAAAEQLLHISPSVSMAQHVQQAAAVTLTAAADPEQDEEESVIMTDAQILHTAAGVLESSILAQALLQDAAAPEAATQLPEAAGLAGATLPAQCAADQGHLPLAASSNMEPSVQQQEAADSFHEAPSLSDWGGATGSFGGLFGGFGSPLGGKLQSASGKLPAADAIKGAFGAMMSPWAGAPTPRQQALSQQAADSSSAMSHPTQDESAVIKAAWSPMQGSTLTSDTRDDEIVSFLSAKSGSMASSEATVNAAEKLGAADTTPQSRLRQEGTTASPAILSAGSGKSPTKQMGANLGDNNGRRAAFASKLAMFNGAGASPVRE